MSWVHLSSLRFQDNPKYAVQTYWCVVCQFSLRTEEESLAHVKVFPTHRVKTVRRIFCRVCGNDMPLENGRLPAHWTGGGQDVHRCRGSGMAP
jgi:hypothetical protein